MGALSSVDIDLPDHASFELPEKVLQFGTGVLLRGLPDYFIDKANKKGLFNGRIVMVKSTSKGDTSDFEKQDGLYTLCVRGISSGKDVKENIVSSSISRVLSASSQWDEILELAKSPELKLVVSNTTEVGIVLTKESIHADPPLSYPAKLLSVLYSRYSALQDESAEIVVIATELIPDNGNKLKSIVDDLVEYNGLETAFIEWLSKYVIFCNSLVDRIIPGKPDGVMLTSLIADLGYDDELLIMAEPYRLWAIEGDGRTRKQIGLEGADDGLIIKPDIEIYRELKVRLLNGTHTLACGIACLHGIDTVAEGMNNKILRSYIESLMTNEIVPAIPYNLELAEATAFAQSVVDRFSNPYIQHQWINITFQYSMKLKIRTLPVLIQYYKLFNEVPAFIAFGFAAYLVFMKVHKKEGDSYKGVLEEKEYVITDNEAPYFYDRQLDNEDFPRNVLKDSVFWSINLNSLPGFTAQVEENYHYITKHGISAALSRLKL